MSLNFRDAEFLPISKRLLLGFGKEGAWNGLSVLFSRFSNLHFASKRSSKADSFYHQQTMLMTFVVSRLCKLFRQQEMSDDEHESTVCRVSISKSVCSLQMLIKLFSFCLSVVSNNLSTTGSFIKFSGKYTKYL